MKLSGLATAAAFSLLIAVIALVVGVWQKQLFAALFGMLVFILIAFSLAGFDEAFKRLKDKE